MPVHDWSRVDAGVFHGFRLSWSVAILRALNGGLLPADHYAMAERLGSVFAADFGAFRLRRNSDGPSDPDPRPVAGGTLCLAEPQARIRAESDLEFYRRKQNVVAVRHASGHELVAVVEIVSRGNKPSRQAMDDFVTKAARILSIGVHLLIVDLQPPSSRDPQGIHGRIWDDVAGEAYLAPIDQPLTVAAYESGPSLRAFVEPIAVGDVLPPMPLFLRPGAWVPAPLEATYSAAWEAVPRRWREVIAGG